MAKTYSAIQTITVGSGGASSVTFSNIPQNYTDLVVKASVRTNLSGSNYDDLYLKFNGSSSSFNTVWLQGNGASASSSNGAVGGGWIVDGPTATTNTFAISEHYIPNYTSSNYKSFSLDVVMENNATTSYMRLTSGLWSNTAAITQIDIYSANGALIVQYSTFTLYGIGTGAKASGGTVTGSGNYMYHTFTSTGTFTPTEQIKNAEVLALAGGGGGGYRQGGGGGAGGLLWLSALTFNAGTNYGCVVGSGGAGSTSDSATGVNGTNSYVNGFTQAIGGGGGASIGGSVSNGLNGGSGGGSAGGGTFSGGTGVTGQGYAGGSANNASIGPSGGGGAGGVGGIGTVSYNAGNGGNGSSAYTSWLYATQQGVNVGGFYYLAGGGGGGANSAAPATAGTGGIGGGGAGYSGNGAGTAGTTNTGSGGGGGGQAGGLYGSSAGGAGGSGLVIIRYPVN